MSAKTKISDITYLDLVYFLRINGTPASDEVDFLNTCLNYAKSYVQYYTGRTQTELDGYPDIISAFLLICQSMYDNRNLYVDKSTLNPVALSALDRHSVNLL